MHNNFTRVALITVCFFNLNLAVPSGSLDTTFNSAGTPPGTVQYSGAIGIGMTLQTDGKVVLAGYSGSNGALVRYTSTGTLDSLFGTGGLVTTSTTDTLQFSAVTIQPDGNLVAAGVTLSGDLFVARYIATNGALDSSFGSGGTVTTPIGSSLANFVDVTLQSDGKIVIAGTSDSPGKFTVVRYTAAGVLDTSFGTGGITKTAIGSNAIANALTIQTDGKIVVGGYASTSGNHFTVARYTAGGILDTTFGGTGIVTTIIGNNSYINGIALQGSPAKIIAVGFSDLLGSTDFTIARYNPNGTVDTSFGTSGITSTYIANSSQAFGVAIQQDGKIVVSGRSSQPPITFTLARYTINGTLDSAFGTGGIVITPYGSSSSSFKVAIATDKKIVASGFFGSAFGAARYFSNPTIIDVCTL